MDFLDLLQGVAAFNFLLIAGLIFYFRKNIQHPIYVFAFFLLAKGITLTSNLIFMNRHHFTIDGLLHITNIGSSFLFFYCFVKYKDIII